MCGRFALTAKTSDIENLVPAIKIKEEIKPRYNIAPTQKLAALLNDGSMELVNPRWGLIPSWSKDESIGVRMINARGETLNEKPAFKNLFRKRRCLIFANGFYEWKSENSGKHKTPYFIRLKSREVFAFAGLWDLFRKPDGETICSATIIPCEPNALMAPIHNRMPVILGNDMLEEWMSTGKDATKLSDFIKPYDYEEMEAYPVSSQVGNPAFDNESCIIPRYN